MKQYLFHFLVIWMFMAISWPANAAYTKVYKNVVYQINSDKTATVTGLRYTTYDTIPRIDILQSVDMATVRSIKADAFSNYGNLLSVKLPRTVEEIGDAAFSSCKSLTSINIPLLVEKIPYRAFSGCSSLTSIDLPLLLEEIGKGAFQTTGIDSIKLPIFLKYIRDEAFLGCKSLKTLTIPSSVVSIWSDAFRYCDSLESIIIPSGDDLKIDDGVFANCSSLTEFVCPKRVLQIGSQAFSNCEALKKVRIEGQTKLGSYCFYDSDNIDSVVCLSKVPPEAGDYVFSATTFNKGVLLVPEEGLDAYKNTYPWDSFYTINPLVASINSAEADDGQKVWVDGTDIRIEGAAGYRIVYDVEGKELVKTMDDTVSGLAPGVYIIKVGGKTYKIRL